MNINKMFREIERFFVSSINVRACVRACVHVHALVTEGASLDAQPFLLRCSPFESPVSPCHLVPRLATPLAIPSHYLKTYRVTSDIIPLIMIS